LEILDEDSFRGGMEEGVVEEEEVEHDADAPSKAVDHRDDTPVASAAGRLRASTTRTIKVPRM